MTYSVTVADTQDVESFALKTNEKNQPSYDARIRDGAASGILVCPNCGGSVSAEDARCPYCGALNPAGAEKAYMDTLEDIKDDTDKLAEDAQEDIEDKLKSNAKWVITFIFAIVLVVAVAFAASKCANSNDERREMQDYQAREAFREEHFPEFDRLYEAGDDAALSEYVWSLMDEPGFDAYASWKHFRYLQAHDDWEALNAFEDELKEGSASIDDYAWAASVAIRLACLDADGKRYASELTQEESGRVAEYRDFARRFLLDMLQMSDEELGVFAASVEDPQGNIDMSKLKEGLEHRFKQLGNAS